MSRDFQDDAEKFLSQIPDGVAPNVEAPEIFEVWQDRTDEFPILREGIEARSSALQRRFGREFGIRVQWGGANTVTRETRLRGEAGGNIVLNQPGKSGNIPFEAAPGEITLDGRQFSAGEDDAMSEHLSALLAAKLHR